MIRSVRHSGYRHTGKILAVLLVLVGATGHSQDSTKVDADSTAINLFIDFPDYYIDLDYFRTEIPFVNFMRDRADADVHLLTTTQGTGGGGREFTITFIGLRRFEGERNILQYSSRQTDTEDIIRKELARYFKIGLLPFVSRSPVIGQMDIIYKKPDQSAEKTRDITDPWDHWTFNTSLSGYFNGEKTYKYNDIYASFSASRVTEAWKINATFSISQTKSLYDYGDELSYTSFQRSRYASASAVKSVTPHWSLGVKTGAFTSTYSNYDLSLSFSPGIEFNVFPYSESTRRQFTFQYLVDAYSYDYHEETIYLRTSERRFMERLNIGYGIKQTWGSISTSLYASHYLHDIHKFNVRLRNDIELRLIKGLSFNCWGYLNFVRDQLSLPSSGATLEEILLRRRELETSYYYYLSVGFSYTLGSIYNNVVNPRFGGF